MTEKEESHFILPQQLCVGLYIHLDLSWMDHPFTFSSFKIKTTEQIAQIRAMGLKRIRYSPERSDTPPAPVTREEVAAPPPAPDEVDPAVLAKRERAAKLREKRAIFSRCEREFMQVGGTLRTINSNLFSRPEWAKEETSALIARMVESLLTDKDVAINLMSDRVGGEEVYFHSLNVTVLSLMLAREMGMSRESVVQLGIGAVFHDIGKMDIPDRVLLKQDALTRAETALLQEHVKHGVNIGRKIGLPPEILLVIAQHHEAVDGSGYPNQLKGEQIGLLAKIVQVANTYDNLCNPSNPARAMTPHEALSLMYAQQRSRYEPGPLNVFIHCLGVYPPGTIVVLSNNAFGIVVSVNSTRPLKPMVIVHEPSIPREEAITVNLEQEPDLSIVRTVRPTQVPRPILDYLSPRKRITYYFDAGGENGNGTGDALRSPDAA